MSRRKVSLSRSQARVRSWLGPVGRAGEVPGRGRSSAAPAHCARTASGPAPVPAGAEAGRYAEPRRLQATRSALGAMAAVAVDLEQGQPLDDREQLGRPWCMKQLRAHRDAPGLRLGEPVHGQGGQGRARRPSKRRVGVSRSFRRLCPCACACGRDASRASSATATKLRKVGSGQCTLALP